MVMIRDARKGNIGLLQHRHIPLEAIELIGTRGAG
jgi:hypothetical protein